MDNKKWILGLTGGVGCGKSTVLDWIEKEYDALVIQADVVAHELMTPGQVNYQNIVGAFGDGILAPDGQIDRSKLGALTFSDEADRLLLNSLTHPAVKDEIRSRISSSGRNFIVVEAALLLDDHYEEICDEIWYIWADTETRIMRLHCSRGYTREKSLSIMQGQLSDAEMRERCDAVIDNSRDFTMTCRQLSGLLESRFPELMTRRNSIE